MRFHKSPYPATPHGGIRQWVSSECGTLNGTVELITGFVWSLRRRPCYGLAVSSLTVSTEKAAGMEIKVYVGNLSKSTTQEELNTLFGRAGDVTSVNIIMDFKRGESKGYGFVTMSAQSEADKAVSMFNSYSLDDHQLKVDLARPREQRGFGTTQ